ncbi:MAG: 4Fe-4S ferredoxin [Bacteroidetes bacterium 4572_77]|nr:MAG: 4Fe-4S ferredoxin [Bacteroidetes bacterium 4572_77]
MFEKNKKMVKKNKENSRRQFLKQGAVALAGLAVVGSGAAYLRSVHGPNDTRTPYFLRPPGAVKESVFIYACIKCGLCVQICPIDAIKLAGVNEGLSYGTPYIDVRTQPCDFSCDSLQCVETCPTAALDFKPFELAGGNAIVAYQKTHNVTDPSFNPFPVQIRAMKEEVRMGKAYVNKDTCLAHQQKGFKGISRGVDFEGIYRAPDSKSKNATLLKDKEFDREICNLCVTECPIGETAIVFSPRHRDGKLRPKVLDACTGCGVCVMVCPTEEPSILINPNHKSKGRGRHV